MRLERVAYARRGGRKVAGSYEEGGLCRLRAGWALVHLRYIGDLRQPAGAAKTQWDLETSDTV